MKYLKKSKTVLHCESVVLTKILEGFHFIFFPKKFLQYILRIHFPKSVEVQQIRSGTKVPIFFRVQIQNHVLKIFKNSSDMKKYCWDKNTLKILFYFFKNSSTFTCKQF